MPRATAASALVALALAAALLSAEAVSPRRMLRGLAVNDAAAGAASASAQGNPLSGGVGRMLLGSKLPDSAARVSSGAAASNSGTAKSVKGAFSASASNGRVSASSNGDWTVEKEESGAAYPLVPAWGQVNLGRRK